MSASLPGSSVPKVAVLPRNSTALMVAICRIRSGFSPAAANWSNSSCNANPVISQPIR